MTMNPLARTLHDVGLAAWFGGSLMGAAGLNAAAASVTDPRERLAVAKVGWDRWTPVNLAGIAAHVAGATALTYANKGRLVSQRGVAGTSAVKTVVLAAALGTTAYARIVGRKLEAAAGTPVKGVTEESDSTSTEVAALQRQEQMLQWAVPALTGALLVLSARLGEQQRPSEVVAGTVRRLVPGL
jgi:hypothetical protein